MQRAKPYDLYSEVLLTHRYLTSALPCSNTPLDTTGPHTHPNHSLVGVLASILVLLMNCNSYDGMFYPLHSQQPKWFWVRRHITPHCLT